MHKLHARRSTAALSEEKVLMDTSTLMWGVILGSIGLGFFIYGKKQKAIVPLISGTGLMVFPYFVSNVFILVATGVVFVALPFLLKR
jgi:hypothetical protein